MYYGWIGVDLFFVLSGFLITDILLNSLGQTGYFSNFYVRRALRIFPIYYLSLILLLIVFPLYKINTPEYDFNISHQAWYWSYTQNWLTTMHPYAGSYGMTPYWSLATEEQFYLLWPFIIAIMRKKKFLFYFLFILLLIENLYRIYLTVSNNEWATELTFNFTRFDGLLVGCLFAVAKAQGNIKALYKVWLSIVILLNSIVLLFWLTDQSCSYLGFAGYTTISILFGFIISKLIHRGNKSIPVINWPLIKQAGKYSYGIYVFHWPAYSLLHPYIEKWFWPVFHSRFPEALFLLLIEISIAVFIYHIFEKHFLKLKKYFYTSQSSFVSPQTA